MNKTSSAIVRTLLLGTTCLSTINVGAALADPTGGTVVTGSATISSTGTATTINQSTNRALINWDSFSIAAGGSVRFNQPNSGSITLNRVIGSAPSSIYGSLLANGQVWLINSNGILFGRGSQVNVGGLIATTSDIADRDFEDGNFNFNGGSGASVVNEGTIRTRSGGSVVLSGASVQNHGLIEADAGTVVLGGASAFTVDFDGDNLLRYAIAAPTGKADNGQTGVSNSGTISANNGGRVIMTARAAADIAGAVINNTGIITATSAKLQNGEVVLDGGDGDVNVAGTIDASGAGSGQTGGSFTAVGRNITVADNTRIDVSGDSGGGTVRIGGDLHGAGTLPNAANVTVGRATIKADATRTGNGGTLVVWSNGLTDFSGIFSAMGGAQGGNGGFAETSGHDLRVGDGAVVDTRAPKGQTGTWLLDPTDIQITVDGGSDLGGSNITPDAIISGLNTTNVTLQASNAITVISAVSYSSANALSLLAQGSIVVKASIQNASNGAINLIAGWNGSTTDLSHLTDATVFGAVGGNVTIGGTAASGNVSVGTMSGITTVAGNDVTLEADHGYAQIGFDGAGGSGAIFVNATGSVFVTAVQSENNSSRLHAQIGNGGVFADGDNSGDITVIAGGDVVVTGGVGDFNYAQIGNGGDSEGSGSNSGNISVTAGGSVSLAGEDDYAQIGNGGFGSHESDSGDVTVVATGDITLTGVGSYGYVQIGNGGQNSSSAASGTVSVTGHGDLTLTGNGGSNFAQIGNGNGQANNGGTVSGAVSIQIDGATTLEVSESGHNVVLGNRTGSDGTSSGDFTLITGSLDDAHGLLTQNILSDIGGGDVMVGLTTGNFYDLGALDYDSSHALSLLSEQGISLSHDVVNNGAGNITVIAGWDGTTTDPAHLTDRDVFGNNEADLYIGAAFGSAQGVTTIAGYNINQSHGITAATLNAYAASSINLISGYYGDASFSNNVGTASFHAAGNVSFSDDYANLTLKSSEVGGQIFVETYGYESNHSITIDGQIKSDADSCGGLACIDIEAGGALSETANGSLVGSSLYASSALDGVTLDNANNAIDGRVDLSAYNGAVNFVDSTGFTLHYGYAEYAFSAQSLNGGIIIDGDVTAGGAMTLLAHDDIAEDSDGRLFGVDLTATSSNGSLHLFHYSNFSGTVSLNAAGDAQFYNYGSLVLGTSTVGGQLDVYSRGGVTQDGAITADSLAVRAGYLPCAYDCKAVDVDLTDTGNNIAGDVSFYASGDVHFVDSVGFSLGRFVDGDSIYHTYVGGDLTATALSGGITINAGVETGLSGGGIGDPTLIADGDITETADGFITGGDLNVTSTHGGIRLDNAGNDLTGVVSLNAHDNALFVTSNSVLLGTSNVAGDLEVVAGHDIGVVGTVQNAASGAVTLIAGWDGGSDPDAWTDAGHFGLNNGTITIGGDAAKSDASVGSAHGDLRLYGANLNIDAVNGYAQLGHHGGAGGDIFVTMSRDITANGGDVEENDFAQLGNGSVSGDVTGNITGDISLKAGGQTVFFNGDAGLAWLGNVAGDGFTETGDVTALTRGGFFRGDYITSDLGTAPGTGGNVFIGFTDPAVTPLFIGGLDYSSPNSFTFAGAGSLNVTGKVSNAGSGDVTLVAGWDGHTVGSAAQLLTAHAYGQGGATMAVGNANQFENVSVGSAGGLTTLLTGNLTIAPKAGYYAQVGYHGATGGAISIVADGDLTMTGGTNPHDYAMIGNGSLNGDVTGNVTGNIDVRVGGTTTLDYAPEGAPAWIGNVADEGHSETGNVVVVSGDIDAPSSVSDMIAADLSGGDVTVGITDSDAQSGIDGEILYNSSHSLNFLSAGSLGILASIQNAGTGAINFVAGWDGHTLDSAHFFDPGHFGNNGGFVLIGSQHADGNVAVGSFGGATNIGGTSVTVSAVNGYAQVGYHGNGSGAVNVTATGGVTVSTGGNNRMALIGNGGTDVTGLIGGAVTVTSFGAVLLETDYQGSIAAIGNVGGANSSESGDVTVNTHGAALTLNSTILGSHTHIGNWTKGTTSGTISGNVHVDAGAVSLLASVNGYSQIGNGSLRFAQDSGDLSGDIVIHAASFTANAAAGAQARVGNLGIGNASGDVSLITTGNISLTGSGGLLNIGDVSAVTDGEGNPGQGHAVSNLLVQSGGTLTLSSFAGGNARIETGGAVGGTVIVSAIGDITLQAGATGIPGNNSLSMIGTLMAGNGGAVISVTSTTGGVYLSASENGASAWIGNRENGTFGGTMTGAITVTASNAVNGNISLSATGANSNAQIGNAGFNGATVFGDITVVAGNAVTFGTGNIIIGNTNENQVDGGDPVPAPFYGNTTISAWSIAGNAGPSIANDLVGGDVRLEVFGPSLNLGGAVFYNSSHMLSILAAGNVTLASGIQNAGTGVIDIVAGWDGHTLDPAHFFDPGAYGNNGGFVVIGSQSADSNVAVGSFGGATNIGASSIQVVSVNGVAQIGYHGAGGGAINLHALGSVVLNGGDVPDWAQIGNGQVFGANVGGDVTILAGAIQGSANAAVTGANLALTATNGNITGSNGSLRIDSSSLAVTTFGGSVFLTSPGSGVSFGGSGVNTGGGSFSLAAAGAITQTAAFHTGQASLSTTSGDITLMNAGNGFGGLTIVTPGNASLRHSSLLTIASANIGGTLTLRAGGSVNQSGAIVAAALDVAAGLGGNGQTGLQGPQPGGSVILGNTSNSFATLTVSTSSGNDATIADSHAVVIAGATVGGTFTLAGGGAVSQSGAIQAASLNVSTTAGAITLNNAGNSFGSLTASTHGSDAAAFTDSTAVSILGATVGGTLTVAANGAIGQTGAIQAGGLNVSTVTGGIVLNNAANAFGTLSVLTHGTDGANFFDSTAVSVAGATVGGTFLLNANGAIGQSGAIHAATLTVTSTGGAIALNNAGNAFGTLNVLTHGSDDASIADSTGLTVASASVGGALTINAGGAIGQSSAIHAASLNVSTTAGAIALNDTGNAFGGLSAVTHGTDDASVADSTGVTISGANVGGTLTLAANGAVGQSGAIHAASLNVSTAGGAIALNNTGNSFGTLNVLTHGADDASFADSTALTVASATVGGGLTLSGGGTIGQTGAIQAAALNVSTVTGAITFTNSANVFGPLTVVTHGGDNASFNASLLTVASANVGGTLTLTTAGSIGQTGAIAAAVLSASASGGAIVLNNAGNSIATLSVHTAAANDATVADSTAVVVAASSVGGKFSLSAGGTIGQSGTIAATALSASTTAGNIVLTNTANAVGGTVQFSTPGTASFYNTLAMNVGASAVGGDFTLLSKGNVNFKGSVQSVNGNIVVVAGWDGVTVDPAAFGNAGVFGNNTGSTTGNIVIGGTGATGAVAVGSQNGTTSLYANNVGVIGVNGTAQLGYHGTGGGAIRVRTLHDVTVGATAFSAMIGNGSLTTDVLGNVTGDIDLRLGGVLHFSGAAQTFLGDFAHSGTETGNLIVVTTDIDDSDAHSFGDNIVADIGGGDVTVGLTGGQDQGIESTTAYNSSHTLSILSVGNFEVAGSIQNAGSGAINLVAGWDGVTLNSAAFGNAGVYGNNGKGVLIGGSNASGNAAFGSAGGTTSIYAASLALTAVNGYAQLGFDGHGAGAIFVKTTGGVTLTGGTGSNQFVQIGNGGRGTSGNNSGDITITAGGDLVLTAGAGSEAYAQVGHGGAESNTGANGYSNVAAITVTAANVLLNAGSGSGAYSMIGNGGYKSGLNLAGGTAVNGGAINITSAHAVSLTGNGADAYAQIGNGGNQSNAGALAAAGGTDSGDIIVHAPNGPDGAVTLTAGAGADAYAMIGNGGYGINMGPTTTLANFTVSGNVSVTDLAISGGNGGANAFGQIGNGDASHNGIANISGDIVINANGQITYTQGSAPHSQATIGNFTGQGTVSGTLTGANPPSDVTSNAAVIGVVVNNTAGNDSPTDHGNGITTIQTVVVPEEGPSGNSAVTLETATPGPLASLDSNSSDSESSHASDGATVVIADSLDGAKKSGSTTILPGVLKSSSASGSGMHAVPPADQDFSSWGNEALWQ